MITTCTGCHTSYRLDASKVPQRRIRVRCPRCQVVYKLDGTQAAARVDRSPAAQPMTDGSDHTAHATPASAPAPAVAPAAPAAPVNVEGGATLDGLENGTPSMADPESDRSTVLEVTEAAPAVATPETTGAAPTDAAPAEQASRPRRKRDKAEMLARALVSDILVYNQDARDKALAEGNLLEALGGEIKKSWELYKEKVTPEVANSTTHFRDALNDILADGEKLF